MDLIKCGMSRLDVLIHLDRVGHSWPLLEGWRMGEIYPLGTGR